MIRIIDLPAGDTPAEDLSRESMRIYDPADFRAAIGTDHVSDDYLGPDVERPANPPRTTEEEIRARAITRILADPRGALRPVLRGDTAMAARVLAATETMPHFAAVTGILHRAVIQSALAGTPVRFPPILMVSPPGIGKTHYCRRVAEALTTTCVPISINATSDRGQLGGLSPLWRGAKIGKLAKGLLVDGMTAAPLFLLDEIDKPPAINEGENTLDILLSALEPENALAFRDEYLDAPIDLSAALWMASANTIGAMAAPLLDRMLVVAVPRPTREQARVVAEAIGQKTLGDTVLIGIEPKALDLLLDLSPRRMRRTLEVASSFATCSQCYGIEADHVRQALVLTEGGDRREAIGFIRWRDEGKT